MGIEKPLCEIVFRIVELFPPRQAGARGNAFPRAQPGELRSWLPRKQGRGETGFPRAHITAPGSGIA